MDWATEESWLDSRKERKTFLYLTPSRPALHPEVKGLRGGGGGRVGTKLNTHLLLVLRLRTSVAAITSFSHSHKYNFTFERKIRQRININTLRTGSFKMFKRPFLGFLTTLTL
jgi:hypothetical protein